MNKQGSLGKPLWRASVRPAIPVRLTRRWRFRKPHDLDEDTAHLVFQSMPLTEHNPEFRGAFALHKVRLGRQLYRAYVEQERAVNRVTTRQENMYATLVRLHAERRHALRALQHDVQSEIDYGIHSEPHSAGHRALPPVRSTSPAVAHAPTRPPCALDAILLPSLPGVTVSRQVDAFFETIPDTDYEISTTRANEVSAALTIGMHIGLLDKCYNNCRVRVLVLYS